MEAHDASQRVRGHERLVKLLRLAYSAERAAAFEYIGHAGSVNDADEKLAIAQIEADEWAHRASVLAIMQGYGIKPSRLFELRFFVVGKMISLSCYTIGWFMPYYFAGRLESGNVCEYFIMMQYFHELEIHDHDDVLYEMGIKEKEHEMFFLEGAATKRQFPVFQRIFGWGTDASYNDVDLADPHQVELSSQYCQARADTKTSRRLRSLQP